MEVNGTLVWYYNICKREVWLMSHHIVPDQQNDNIDFGKYLHEQTNKRKQKEILFGNVKFDVLIEKGDKLVSRNSRTGNGG
jgi:CRISPR-associated exonuclease Cas4